MCCKNSFLARRSKNGHFLTTCFKTIRCVPDYIITYEMRVNEKPAVAEETTGGLSSRYSGVYEAQTNKDSRGLIVTNLRDRDEYPAIVKLEGRGIMRAAWRNDARPRGFPSYSYGISNVSNLQRGLESVRPFFSPTLW